MCLRERMQGRKEHGGNGGKNNRGLFKMASNKAALMECKQQYKGMRGGHLNVSDKPVLIEQCYHLKTGKYPWQ